MDHAAYFFVAEAENTLSDADYKPTMQAVAAWKHKWDNSRRPPYLHFRRFHSGIQIYDGRDNPHHPSTYFYPKPVSDVYLFCSDRPRTAASIVNMLGKTPEVGLDERSVHGTLERFVERGLMVTEDGRYLSLALPHYYRL